MSAIKPANGRSPSKIISEQEVIEELLSIYHMAELRMRTCIKFCLDVSTEEELIEKINPGLLEQKEEKL